MIHYLRYVVLLLAVDTRTITEEIQLSAVTGRVSQTPSSSNTIIVHSSPQTSSLNDIVSSISPFSRKRIKKMKKFC